MSKGNVLLGYARGKVGDVVFSRRNGEQITSARNRNPRNPRTPRQMFQRSKLYPMVNFYRSAVATQFKYAYADKKQNESDYNVFVRKNMALSPWVTKELASSYAPIPFPALVADGGAPSITAACADFSESSGGAGKAGVGINFAELSSIDNGHVSDVSINMMRMYPEIKEGDLVTFIALYTTGLSIEGGNVLFDGVNGLQFKAAQFVVDTIDVTPISEHGLTPCWLQGQTQNPKCIALLTSESSVEEEGLCFGGAIVVTRQEGSKIVAGNSRVNLNEFANDVYQLMRTETYRDKAAASYGASAEPLLDPTKV